MSMEAKMSEQPLGRGRIAALRGPGFVFGLGVVTFLVGVASTPIRSQTEEEKVCLGRLKRLGAAIQMYERKTGKLPQTLGTLYPTHLGERSAFVCPVARDGPEDDRDRKGSGGVRTTYQYVYEMATRLGRTPPKKRDLGAPASFYSSWERVKRLRGTSLPVLLCGYHGYADERAPAVMLVLRLNGSVEKSIKYPDKEKDGNLLWYEF